MKKLLLMLIIGVALMSCEKEEIKPLEEVPTTTEQDTVTSEDPEETPQYFNETIVDDEYNSKGLVLSIYTTYNSRGEITKMVEKDYDPVEEVYYYMRTYYYDRSDPNDVVITMISEEIVQE